MLEFLYAFLSRLFFFTGAVRDEGSYPKPLPKEEEEKYLALARGGDRKARDMLVRHNMRLVAHIVKKYNGYYRCFIKDGQYVSEALLDTHYAKKAHPAGAERG